MLHCCPEFELLQRRGPCTTYIHYTCVHESPGQPRRTQSVTVPGQQPGGEVEPLRGLPRPLPVAYRPMLVQQHWAVVRAGRGHKPVTPQHIGRRPQHIKRISDLTSAYQQTQRGSGSLRRSGFLSSWPAPVLEPRLANCRTQSTGRGQSPPGARPN